MQRHHRRRDVTSSPELVAKLSWPLLTMTLGASLLVSASACDDSGRGRVPVDASANGGAGGTLSPPTAEPSAQRDGSALAADASMPGARAGSGAVLPIAGSAPPSGDASVPVEHDGGDSGAAMPVERETRPLTNPPSYLGSVDNSAGCTQRYPTKGFEPIGQAGERFPLFLYFVGTAFVQPDPSASYESAAAVAVGEAMARRGFVALSVAYDNSALAWLSDHEAQLACLFTAASADSAIAVACALPQVDCELGIATWGHSQGALVGLLAARFDARVRAAWTTGYGGDGRSTLSPNRLRVVNGEADTNNGTPEVLNSITGLSAADCPAGASTCLRPDGSGWIIVRRSELAAPESSSADHCWFDKRACLDSAIALEPTWVDRASTRAYAIEPNADWLARTARTP
jgi:hypothetical protein